MNLAATFTAKAPAIVRASKYWTPRRMADVFEAQAPKRRVAAHELEGMIENRKVVALTPQAFAKYRRALTRAGYVIKKSMPVCQSKCDATGEFCATCVMLFPKEIA